MDRENDEKMEDTGVPATEPGLVSIVIPCYNHARYLGRAIRSAMDQSHEPAEVLVIDDGSTDGSAEVAASFEPKVRVISQANQGLAGARNTGIRESSGEFLVFLDSDDWLEPDAVERMLRVFGELPVDYGVVGTRMNVAGADGRIVTSGEGDERDSTPRDVTWEDLVISRRCARFPCSALVRREVFDECGGFDSAFRSLGSEDRDMWIRAAARFGIRRIPDRVLNVAVHGSNMSANPRTQLPGMRRCLSKAWRSGSGCRWCLGMWGKAWSYYFYQASIMHLDRGNAGWAVWNSLLCVVVYPLPGLSALVGLRRWSRPKRVLISVRQLLFGRGS